MIPVIAKASKLYLIIACVFFAFAAVFFFLLFLVDKSGNPVLTRLCACALPALPGVVFALIYRNKRIEIDDSGVTVRNLFGKQKHYSRDDITKAELIRGWTGNKYRACIIRSNGKKIVEIPLAFDGYFDAVDYLRRWKILREKRK